MVYWFWVIVGAEYHGNSRESRKQKYSGSGSGVFIILVKFCLSSQLQPSLLVMVSHNELKMTVFTAVLRFGLQFPFPNRGRFILWNMLART